MSEKRFQTHRMGKALSYRPRSSLEEAWGNQVRAERGRAGVPASMLEP